MIWQMKWQRFGRMSILFKKIDIRHLLMRSFMFFAFLFASCSHKELASNQISVLSNHIERVQDNLSRVDGKAVVIEKWLRSH